MAHYIKSLKSKNPIVQAIDGNGVLKYVKVNHGRRGTTTLGPLVHESYTSKFHPCYIYIYCKFKNIIEKST